MIRALAAGAVWLVVVAVKAMAEPATTAPASPAYTIEDVQVDETAADAATARRVAIARGESDAFRRLIERLVLASDQDRALSLEAGEVSRLIRGFEVADEKTSGTRYLATMTFHFDPEGVRTLLKNEGLAFSEMVAEPVVLLPVYEAAGFQTLWSAPNPWFDAWKSEKRLSGLVPIVVPHGDLEDVRAIALDEAVVGERDAISTILERYGASEAIVARATLASDAASGRPVLDVALAHYGTGGEAVEVERYVGEAGEPISEFLTGAANLVARQLNERWKRETLLMYGTETTISASVDVRSFDEWLKIRRSLEKMPMVQAMKISSLRVGDAQIELTLLGEPQQLANALVQQDLMLAYRGGYWMLQPASSYLRYDEAPRVFSDPQLDVEPTPTNGTAP